jgi:SAM-dependent methyltransferase
MVGWAQNRASDAGLADRLEIRLQDAQTADLEPVYDAAFSRFGVMFFDDPVAALSNVHGALQPGGRLAFACWQAPDLNPWIARSMEVAGRYAELPPPAEPGAPGPFSLADPDTVRGILGRAGFSGVEFTDVRAPLIVGTTAGDAAHWFSGTGAAAAAIKQGERPVETLAEFREALRSVFEPWFEEGHGVAAPSAAWIVSAQA